MNASTQRPFVAEYYGETLQSSADLKTSACCPVDAVPPQHRAILAALHPTVLSRFYGCGSPIPDLLTGATVLDLGCGTGRDAFLAAALAGPAGTVIGVDMTDNQLAVARGLQQWHADKFFGQGARVTTDFRTGFIEDLRAAGVHDDSVDVVISNCVCNLSPNKRAVFAEVARCLREGGELYFSDVYADRRLSAEARAHPVLVAECLGGALYLEDFRRIMAEVGLHDVRVVSSAPIDVHDPALKALVPDVRFFSVTARAFKVSGLEDRREDYGQCATFLGESELKLDRDFTFTGGVAKRVDANTASILQCSRFAPSFVVTKKGEHRGLFAPEVEGGALVAAVMEKGAGAEGCCIPKAGNGMEQVVREEGKCCGGEMKRAVRMPGGSGVVKSAKEGAEERQGNVATGCCGKAAGKGGGEGRGNVCGETRSEVVAQPGKAAKVTEVGCGSGSTCC